MHYIHRLSTWQKRALISAFILVPIVVLVFLFSIWAKKEKFFSEYINLKTVISSAEGIDLKTMVSFSGFKIGKVTKIRLNEDDAIEVTMKIEKEYQPRIHQDATVSLGTLAIFGMKGIKIMGGSKNLPHVEDGATLPLSQKDLEMDNLLDRIQPIVNSAEEAFMKLTKIVNSFPNEKVNSAVENASEIIGKIQKGESSAGQFLASDKAEFYKKLDRIAGEVELISEKVREATKHLPKTAKDAKELVGNAAAISGRVKETTKELNIDELQKVLLSLLKNLDKTMEGISELSPALKNTAEALSETSEELKQAAPQIPVILNDIEITLSESLMLLQSIKTSWPVKNFAVPEKTKPDIGTPRRDTPYRDGGTK